MPPQGVLELLCSLHIGIDAGASISAMAWKPPRKAKEEPRKAGTFSRVHTWKNSVPKPAKKRVVWMDRGRP